MKRHRTNLAVAAATAALLLAIPAIRFIREANLPDYKKAARAGMHVCPKHLETIDDGLRRYARDHGDLLPPDLTTLRSAGYATEKWELVCPNSNDTEDGCSYELLAAGAKLSGLPAGQIIAREREFNHDIEPNFARQCRFLLRANGSVTQEFRAYSARPAAVAASRP